MMLNAYRCISLSLFLIALMAGAEVAALDVVVLKTGAELRGEAMEITNDHVRLDLLPGEITLRRENVSAIRKENNPEWYLRRLHGRPAAVAVEILESALRSGNTNRAITRAYANACRDAARIALAENRPARAEYLARRAHEAAPDSKEAAEFYLQTQAYLARALAEARALETEVAEKPENDYARLLLGDVYRRIGRDDDAFKQYTAIVAGKIERTYQRNEMQELREFIAANLVIDDDTPPAIAATPAPVAAEMQQLAIPGFLINFHDPQTGNAVAQALPEVLPRVATDLHFTGEFACTIHIMPDQAAFRKETGHRWGDGYSKGDTIWTYHGANRMLANIIPHELAHVLVHRMFGRIPLWLDEGLAVRQEATAGAYWHVLKTDGRLALAELLATDGSAETQQDSTRFYASAYSFVDMLITLRGMEGIHNLIEALKVSTTEQALLESYAIGSLKELEERWQMHLQN